MSTLSHRMTAVAVLLALVCSCARVEDAVEFNRDIRPILSDNCFACHGHDRNRAQVQTSPPRPRGGSRRAGRPEGHRARKPEESELYLHHRSEQGERKPMPPAKFGETVAAADRTHQADRTGAKYEKHWSLIAPSASNPRR
jgi:hypothetical protein